MGEVFVCAHNLSGLSPLSLGPVNLSRTAWQLDLWQRSFEKQTRSRCRKEGGKPIKDKPPVIPPFLLGCTSFSLLTPCSKSFYRLIRWWCQHHCNLIATGNTQKYPRSMLHQYSRHFSVQWNRWSKLAVTQGKQMSRGCLDTGQKT